MTNFEFKSITINDIPRMTDLLIGRQNLESNVFPFLRNNSLNVKDILDNFEKLFVNSKVIGIGAFINDELVGYIIGEIKFDNRRGRYVSVPYEGIVIKTNQSPELIRYIYAKVSVLWLEQGCFDHIIIVPVANKVYYEAFLHLSFAIEQVHAVLDIEEYKTFENISDVNIRLAEKMDSEALGNMSSIISQFQNSAPVFMPVFPEMLERIKEAFKGLVEDDDVAALLIAEKDKKELGFQVYEFITQDLMTPDDGVELSVAGTYISQMGSGIGKKLMNEACKVIKDKGYSYIISDWRITNLASSTFWPKCGFKPVAYRMARHIDNKYAWANFNNPSVKKLK